VLGVLGGTNWRIICFVSVISRGRFSIVFIHWVGMGVISLAI